jgi:hypothetical protein
MGAQDAGRKPIVIPSLACRRIKGWITGIDMNASRP